MSEKWSQDVTQHRNALDLGARIFAADDPKRIAASLKRSAERSARRKASPYQSAMSMLNFYINRAGHNLSKAPRETGEGEGRTARCSDVRGSCTSPG